GGTIDGSVKIVLTTLLAALGLAYACLWWSFDRFYGEFGVSPQDVGLAPSGGATDLADAALQLGIWLLIVLTAMALLPVAALLAMGLRGWRRALAFGWAALLLAVAAFLYWWLVDEWDGLAVLGGAAVVFALVAGGGYLVGTPSDEQVAGLMKAVTPQRLAL